MRTHRTFIATYFFAMPYRTYVAIGGLSAPLPWDDWLGARWPEPLFRLPGETAYNRFGNAWLGCSQPGGVGRWPHSAGHPFTAANYKFLRAKAQCILLEGRLAALLTACDPRLAVSIYHPEPWNTMWQRLFRVAKRGQRLVRSHTGSWADGD